MTGETGVVEDCGHPILDTIGNMAVRLMELARERDEALAEAKRLQWQRDISWKEAAELRQERDKLREMVDRYFLVIYTLQQQIPDERRKDVAQAVVKALEAE
jgi:hypothetical protein